MPPNWKISATLILAGVCERMSLKKTCDYRVLMLKRKSQSRNFANSMVFPGGLIDKADCNPDWLNICAKSKLHDQLIRDLQGRMRMPLYLDTERDMEPGNPMSGELALRICALRETFEETGLLLAKDPSAATDARIVLTAASHPDLLSHTCQSRVKSDPCNFIALFQRLSLVPDVFSLHEWSNWLTPTNLPSRYDTAFYFVDLPATFPITEDREESQLAMWKSPEQFLRRYFESKLQLFPPQIYELGRMWRFKKLQQLASYSQARACLGSERCLPKGVIFKDGFLMFYPGDERYPKDIDLIESPVHMDSISIASFASDVRKNRFILERSVVDGVGKFHMPDVTEERMGHVKPASLDEILASKAKL